MEYYTAAKINELKLHLTTWMNLTNIILSKKTKFRVFTVFHLHKALKV